MGSGSTKAHEPSTVVPAGVFATEAAVAVESVAGEIEFTPGQKWEAVTETHIEVADPLDQEPQVAEDVFLSGHVEVIGGGLKVTAEGDGGGIDNPDPDVSDQVEEDSAGVEPEEPPASELEQSPALEFVPGLGSEWGDEDVLTPLPEAVLPTDPVPHPLLIAGEDFENGNVALVALEAKDGPVEVVYGWVRPDAEDKILEAIIDEKGMVEVQVPEMVDGPVAADIDNNFGSELVIAVKSVKHHVGKGSEIPAHTHERLQNLTDIQEKLAADASPEVQAMLDHYGPALEATKVVAAGSGSADAIGHIDTFTTKHEAMMTKKVPAAELDGSGPDLVGVKKSSSRLNAKWVDSKRTLPGEQRKLATAHDGMYEIDLGGGFVARYHVHGEAPKGMQGLVEIQAPAGAGRQAELVGRLSQLNLHNTPLSSTDAEHNYLLRNAWAQGVDNRQGVISSINSGRQLATTCSEMLASERAHEAIGMSRGERTAWAKSIRLEADTQTAAARTSMLRDAVAKELKVSSGAELLTMASYDPTPTRNGASYTFNRFDVTETSIAQTWQSRKLTHNVTGNNLDALLTDSGGVLAATEHRRFMGTKNDVGMSEAADTNTGGSRAVFLRVKNSNFSSSGQWLEWKQPAKLLARSDWYGYNGDKYGAFMNKTQTRSPAALANMTASSNEVMFRDGIDLLGPQGPDRIHMGSSKQASKTIATLKKQGRTEIRGMALEEVIVQ